MDGYLGREEQGVLGMGWLALIFTGKAPTKTQPSWPQQKPLSRENPPERKLAIEF